MPTVIQLRKMCEEKGLNFRGTKSDLFERLRSAGIEPESDAESDDLPLASAVDKATAEKNKTTAAKSAADERNAAPKAAAARITAETAAAVAKAAAAKIAAEEAADRMAAAKSAADEKSAMAKAAAAKIAAEETVDRIAAEKSAADRAAAEGVAVDKSATDKIAAEKAVERNAPEKTTAEKVFADKTEKGCEEPDVDKEWARAAAAFAGGSAKFDDAVLSWAAPRTLLEPLLWVLLLRKHPLAEADFRTPLGLRGAVAHELCLLFREHLRCTDLDGGLVLEDMENIATRLRLHPEGDAAAFFTRNRHLLQTARGRLQDLQLAVIAATSSDVGNAVRGRLMLAALPLSDEMRAFVDKSRVRRRSESPDEPRRRHLFGSSHHHQNNHNHSNNNNNHRGYNAGKQAANQKCRFCNVFVKGPLVDHKDRCPKWGKGTGK